MQTATPKTPHYRIDDPATGLAVKFQCIPACPGESPRVIAQLAPPSCATIFATWQHAADCFARYLQGQALEIARVDA